MSIIFQFGESYRHIILILMSHIVNKLGAERLFQHNILLLTSIYPEPIVFFANTRCLLPQEKKNRSHNSIKLKLETLKKEVDANKR